MSCCAKSEPKIELKTNLTKNIIKSDQKLSGTVILLGGYGVGKTSILNRLSEGGFDEKHIPTVGIDYVSIIKILKNGEKFLLKIFDTAGQERYRSLNRHYFKFADAFILIFDFKNINSFYDLEFWLDVIIQNIHYQKNNIPVILVGNKFENNIEIELDKVYEFSKTNNLIFFETSARFNTGINEMKDHICELISNVNHYKDYSLICNNYSLFNHKYEEKLLMIEKQNKLLIEQNKLIKEQLEDHKNKLQIHREEIQKQDYKLDNMKNCIEPKIFKPDLKILENSGLYDYYSAFHGKLYSILLESEAILSCKLELKKGNIKTNIISSTLLLIPIIGKYIGKFYKSVIEFENGLELIEYAIRIKSSLGKAIDDREYVIKKLAENITLKNEEIIYNADSNKEIILWRKRNIINKVKDYFISDAKRDIYNNNYQILGCIDALKVIQSVLKGNLKSDMGNEDIISYLMNSFEKFGFNGGEEIIEKEEISDSLIISSELEENLLHGKKSKSLCYKICCCKK